MPGRQLTLMTVHAHPDDEATSTGGVLAKAAAEGVRTVLVTCTDGSCGDGPGGVKPGDPGHDPAAVVELRRKELEASCEILKVTDLEWLGYTDSGMMGWDTNDAPGSFWRTPIDVAAAKLATLIEKYSPDVIVTYDEYGFYGHPDHIQANRVTMAAIAMTGSDAKVYWTTFARSKMVEFEKALAELGMNMADEVPSDGPEIGLPDDEITTFVDTSAFGAQKFESLAAHGSQGENIFFLQMGVERFTQLMGVEAYVRVKDSTNAPLPEDDLFAGLR
ncbi:MAG: PIG-L family deacetylase [Frankiaceae bacterium]|nr:PIG-L family deacetylase [Frankiaceae bacterium]